jgi:hypothetical protein
MRSKGGNSVNGNRRDASRCTQLDRGVTVLGLVGCCGLFAIQCWWHRDFMVDDAYISFRYARNLVEGHGLVFNQGERVEGYSNFLWVLLIAAGMKLGLASPETLSKVLGVASGLLLILLAPASVRAVTNLRGCACLLGALALAAWPPLAYWSVGGLETTFFALLLTLLSCLAGRKAHPREERRHAGFYRLRSSIPSFARALAHLEKGLLRPIPAKPFLYQRRRLVAACQAWRGDVRRGFPFGPLGSHILGSVATYSAARPLSHQPGLGDCVSALGVRSVGR